MSPQRLYRNAAIAEMITWTLLIAGMVLKYTGITEWGVRVAGLLHGFAFLSYGLSNVFVGLNQRWSPGLMVLGIASTFVPWATYPYDRMLERRGLLEGPWRHEEARGLRGWLLAHPLLASGLALIGIVCVMGVLLWLGPPTQWGTRFS